MATQKSDQKQKYDQIVMVRMTVEELKLIDAAAKILGHTRSGFCRWVAVEAAKQRKAKG